MFTIVISCPSLDFELFPWNTLYICPFGYEKLPFGDYNYEYSIIFILAVVLENCYGGERIYGFFSKTYMLNSPFKEANVAPFNQSRISYSFIVLICSAQRIIVVLYGKRWRLHAITVGRFSFNSLRNFYAAQNASGQVSTY